MAKINESIIVVKVSELVKDHAPSNAPLDSDAIAQLEAVVKELAGGHALVEIETVNPEGQQ
jgi:hypothetical protein